MNPKLPPPPPTPESKPPRAMLLGDGTRLFIDKIILYQPEGTDRISFLHVGGERVIVKLTTVELRDQALERLDKLFGKRAVK